MLSASCQCLRFRRISSPNLSSELKSSNTYFHARIGGDESKAIKHGLNSMNAKEALPGYKYVHHDCSSNSYCSQFTNLGHSKNINSIAGKVFTIFTPQPLV